MIRLQSILKVDKTWFVCTWHIIDFSLQPLSIVVPFARSMMFTGVGQPSRNTLMNKTPPCWLCYLIPPAESLGKDPVLGEFPRGTEKPLSTGDALIFLCLSVEESIKCFIISFL